MTRLVLWVILLVAAFGSLGCSIPSFATPECAAAKPALREFYSFHVGNDMTFSPQNLERRKRFLTPRFAAELSSFTGIGDPFTVRVENLPRAFRASECETIAPDRVSYEVLLFWKDEEASRQQPIKVELQKTGEEWLIDRIVN